MIAHLKALRSVLGVSYPVDLLASEPGRTGQWIVLEAPAWASDPDEPICATSSAFQTEVRLKAITGTPEGVTIMLGHARSVLPGVVPVAGRHVTVEWARSEFIDMDTSVTIPGKNRHPAYGVDTFILTSQPTDPDANVTLMTVVEDP